MHRVGSITAAILVLGGLLAVGSAFSTPAVAGDHAEAILTQAMREVESVEELVRFRERVVVDKKREIQRLCADWGINSSHPPGRGAQTPGGGAIGVRGKWELQLSREAAGYLEAMDERIAALRGARIALDFHRRRLRDELLRARALQRAELDGILSSLSADLESFRKLAAAPLPLPPAEKPSS